MGGIQYLVRWGVALREVLAKLTIVEEIHKKKVENRKKDNCIGLHA